MKNIHQKYLYTSLSAWLLVTSTGWIASYFLDTAIRFFVIWLGIISLVAIVALWRNSTSKNSQSIQSAMFTLVIISLKMFASGGVFIYYFYFNKEKIFIPLVSGFLLFVGYTIIETILGFKLSKLSKEA